MKKFSEIFLTGVFGIFLIVSMVMTVSNREDVYSYYENRLYAEMPEISAENVIEGDFFNVVGLPVGALAETLERDFGFKLM